MKRPVPTLHWDITKSLDITATRVSLFVGQKLTDSDHLNATFESDSIPHSEHDTFIITNNNNNNNTSNNNNSNSNQSNQAKRVPKGLHDSMISYYLLRVDPDGDVTVQVHPTIVAQLTGSSNNNTNNPSNNTGDTVRGVFVTAVNGEKMVFSKDSGV